MRSELQWAESDKKLLERVRTNPLPPLYINGKRLDDWKPTITNNLDKLPRPTGGDKM